jgi:hypothetical protein
MLPLARVKEKTKHIAETVNNSPTKKETLVHLAIVKRFRKVLYGKRKPKEKGE